MVQRLSREERDYTLAHLSPAQIDEWDARGHLVHLAEADRFAARLRAFINREVPVTGAALDGNHVILKLMNHPSILDADGLPFVLDRFELDGRVP